MDTQFKDFVKEQLKTRLEELPEPLQIRIKEDIRNRLIPQAEVVFQTNPNGLKDYIDNEVARANNAMGKMLEQANNPNTLNYYDKISETYVYNNERRKALEEYYRSVSRKVFDEEHFERVMKTVPKWDKEVFREPFREAFEVGFMTESEDGYKFHGDRQLAYFLHYLFCVKQKVNLPQKECERVFGVSGLSKIYDKVGNLKRNASWM